MSNDFIGIKTVYSYYLPEVREIIDGLTYEFPHGVYLKSTAGKGLDEIEKPVINQFREFQKDALPGLDGFPYQYWTAGSEEGIREYMTYVAATSKTPLVYALKNEYEGYDAVADTRGIKLLADDMGTGPVGHYFISNPSARDGNILPDSTINRICSAGHKVFYDLSYLGSTQSYKFDLTHENIDAVAVSFSKPYGLFYYRIGMLFCKHEVPGLRGNKWFKNVLSIMIAQRLMEEIGSAMTIPQRYKPLQSYIVGHINETHGLGLECSDAFLLAYRKNAEGLTEDQLAMLAPFKRGDGYRVCLTRYYETWEKQAMQESVREMIGPRETT